MIKTVSNMSSTCRNKKYLDHKHMFSLIFFVNVISPELSINLAGCNNLST